MWARSSTAVAAGSVGEASTGGSVAVAVGSGVLVGGAGVVVGMATTLVKASVGAAVVAAGALGRASSMAPSTRKLMPISANSAMPATISQLGKRAAGGVVIGGGGVLS